MVSTARRNRVKELWLGLPETWRTQIASAWHTFGATFLGVFGAFVLSALEMPWTQEALYAAATAAFIAAIRAGFKAVSIAFFSRTLPDPKKK
jgi:hypothetical protein